MIKLFHGILILLIIKSTHWEDAIHVSICCTDFVDKSSLKKHLNTQTEESPRVVIVTNLIFFKKVKKSINVHIHYFFKYDTIKF